jgi:hypothetical protein
VRHSRGQALAAVPAGQAATEQPEVRSVANSTEEWLSLGVFTLAQEQKGDAVMFFQISVNRAGVISGAYQSVLTDEALPIAGRVDKTSQRVAWRIGDKTGTVFESSLANLMHDVSPVLIHFGKERTQTGCSSACLSPRRLGSCKHFPKHQRLPRRLRLPERKAVK